MVGAKYQSIVGNVNQIFFALGTGVVSGNFNCFSVTSLMEHRTYCTDRLLEMNIRLLKYNGFFGERETVAD